MLYKLILVDDEEIIRDGLSDIVNWNALGFEVVAKFEDGQDALLYLENNHVDLVITDIKMTFLSGLELAKYIFANHPNTKVIIISGYRDFEFAQMAIEYNVKHYLLKTFCLDELISKVNEIKTALDKEDKDKLNNDQLLEIIQKQFFIDLASGNLPDKKEIEKRFQLSKFDFDLYQWQCCLIRVCVQNYEDFIQKHWTHGSDSFYNAFKNLITVEDEKIGFYITFHTSSRLHLLAFNIANYTNEVFKNKVTNHLEGIRTEAKNLLNLDIFIETELDSLINLVTNNKNNDYVYYDHDIIAKAKEYIKLHCSDDITLEDVAGEVFLSPDYLSRIFKQQTNENFTDFLIKERMEKAAELLKNSRYKVYEVSTLVGYKTTKYFSKLFKQYTGLTPNEYKNHITKESEGSNDTSN